MKETMIEVPELKDSDVVFGNIKHLPKWEEIPKEFKDGHTTWNALFNTWFYNGLKKSQITVKTGVDKNNALRALKAIIGSFEPKHEHKEAGAAYLMSQWFEKWECNSTTTKLNGESNG